MAKLTKKQQRFVNEYLIDLNATQATIRAGYSKDSAKEIGCQNLTKPIMKYIQSLDRSIGRQIVWLRAACCLLWRVIAKEVGGSNTKDSVRKNMKDYFEKIVVF